MSPRKEDTPVKAGQIYLDERRFSKVIKEFLSGNDRTTALLGASLIDDALEQAIRSMMKGHKKPVKRLFAGSNPPLGSFSAKIHLAAAFDLIGPVTYEDLDDRIRNIRNAFAHQMLMPSKELDLAYVTFDTPDIVKWCNKLTLVVKHYNFPKDKDSSKNRFVQTCLVVSLMLVGALNRGELTKCLP